MRLRPKIILGRPNSYGSLSIRILTTKFPVKVLVYFSIFYLCLVQYLRYANYRDPTSYFFDPSRAYQRIYSTDRINEADAFIKLAELVPSDLPPSNGKPVMCIGVATVKRRGEQYVQSTIGSLLEGLTIEERSTIYLDILVGHTDPSKHPISSEKWLASLPNKVLKYKEMDMDRIQEWEEGGWYRNKTIFDYTYLLNDCYSSGARYIAMVEDDTLAVEGWYGLALEALGAIEKNMARRPAERWVYMRLFYTEDLFGWNSENWLTYFFWSFMSWAIMTGCLVIARKRSRSAQRYLSDTSILTISVLCIPALIAIFFAAGRNSIWPLKPGVREMNKFGCCSQGYIYPREIVPFLLDMADLETDWLVDMMVEDIANEEGWIKWVRAPALLQHIGRTSSKGYGFDDTAGRLWNFGFELYKKSRLISSHE
jgi:hypothetical protein